VAKQGEPNPTPFQTVAGIDESVDLTDKGDTLALAEGVFPFFFGMHQRQFGKKIIDFNPGQKVYGIHQTFNGVCLYGYYVETDQKLYYHVCVAPPDLRIVFATLQP
jgi:hypothetical protein